jgi:hypothetical protein
MKGGKVKKKKKKADAAVATAATGAPLHRHTNMIRL